MESGQARTAKLRAKLRMGQAVLRWAWDPIGVRGIPEAFDEYDAYAPALLDMLDRGATNQEIADHLAGVVHDRMALRPDPDREAAVAALLRELHAILA